MNAIYKTIIIFNMKIPEIYPNDEINQHVGEVGTDCSQDGIWNTDPRILSHDDFIHQSKSHSLIYIWSGVYCKGQAETEAQCVTFTCAYPANKAPYSNIATMLPFGFYQMATL